MIHVIKPDGSGYKVVDVIPTGYIVCDPRPSVLHTWDSGTWSAPDAAQIEGARDSEIDEIMQLPQWSALLEALCEAIGVAPAVVVDNAKLKNRNRP